MGRLSVGVAPCSRRPLDAGRCCGLRGCNIRPPSIHPHLAIKMPHKLFVLCASGQVLPSMVLLGRARALRACDTTTHPCAWVAWCVRALGFCPGAASLEGVEGVLARYQAREQTALGGSATRWTASCPLFNFGTTTRRRVAISVRIRRNQGSCVSACQHARIGDHAGSNTQCANTRVTPANTRLFGPSPP